MISISRDLDYSRNQKAILPTKEEYICKKAVLQDCNAD
jgi:hypothetical protein